MRTITTVQARVYASDRPRYDVRVWTKDALGTSVNLGSFLGGGWVRGVDWGEDVDSPGMDATISLARARNSLSLAPGRIDSAANLTGTLLAPARELWIEAAILPTTRAVQSGDWIEVFRGQVQDVDWGDPEAITLTAIGLQGLLQAAWITTVSEYGSSGGTAVETVIQDVLDDWSPSPVPTLSTPVSPGWLIAPAFQSQIQSVWDEIIQCADSLGWCLRYLWDDGSSSWKLTLYEPDRTMSGLKYALPPHRWHAINKATDSLDNVRNEVQITFPDSDNIDANGQGTTTTYTTTDAGSVAAYGSRWMGITLDATSLIDTLAEATTMGDAILDDVAYPKTAWEVVIPYFHAVELGDILTLEADHIWLDADQDVTVVGYRHKLSDDELRTTIQCRAAGAVAHHSSWLERAAQRGVAPLLQTHSPPAPGDYPPNIREVNGAVHVSPDLFWTGRKGGFKVEVHAGEVGFTPDLLAGSTTIIGQAKSGALHIPTDTTRLPVGVARDVVVYYTNDRGVRSSEYRLTRTAKRPGLAWIDPEARVAGSFGGSVFTPATRGTTYPPDGWYMGVGVWGTDALQDSGGTLTGPLTGTYALTLTTSSEVELDSDIFPVTVGRCYVSQVAFYTDRADSGDVVTVQVQWYDDSALSTLIATDTIYDAEAQVVADWQVVKRDHSPPTGAKYARIKVVKAATDFSFSVDRMLLEEDAERDDEDWRLSLTDDFPGADGAPGIGVLPWALFHEEPGSGDAGPASITKIASTGWARSGIVSLETPDPGVWPLVGYNLTLGTTSAPMFVGTPPPGTLMSWLVRMGTATTDVRAWVGVWENQAQQVGPNGEGIADFQQRGIGFIAHGGTWYGIVRVIVSTAHVNREQNMGVAADTTWRRLSWRCNDSGVAFYLNGVQVGSTVSLSDYGGSTATFPMFGLAATATDIPSIQVDKMALHTLLDRS